MVYVRRTVDLELDDLFPHVAAIALDGPKAVGKTTTAAQRAAGIVNLDRTAERVPLEADPGLLLSRPRPLLIDEWQNVPEVWDVVRHAADRDPSGSQFLLAGSATPRAGATAHSGAGRIGRLRMRPMTLEERGVGEPAVSLTHLLEGGREQLHGQTDVGLSRYVEEILASGFPALRSLSGRARRFQLESYLRNAVDRDVPEQGLAVRRPDALMAWLRAYAAATSSTAGYSQILDAATPGQGDKPARSTADGYRRVLESLWLLDPVPAWELGGSQFTRLGRSPKHHLADPALAARLLGLNEAKLLGTGGGSVGPEGRAVLGSMFESLATLCIRVAAQAAEADVGHLRTRDGDHEVDLVVTREDGAVLAIEVKAAGAVDDGDTKHLQWLRKQMGQRLIDSIIVNTGTAAYRRPDGVGVVPLALIGV